MKRKSGMIITAITLSVSMLTGMFSGSVYAENLALTDIVTDLNGEVEREAADKYDLANPRIVPDSKMLGGQKVTYDCVWFGNYWQEDTNGDNYADKDDDKQPIKWRVLSVDGDDAFLLADKILEYQKFYPEENIPIKWDRCTLRSWLNGYGPSVSGLKEEYDYSNNNFIDEVFSPEEQAAIIETEIVNKKNPYYNTFGCDNTLDRIFALSQEEAENAAYGFTIRDRAKEAKQTSFVKRCVYKRTGFAAGLSWWTRSPGGRHDYVVTVSDVCSNYGSSAFATIGVRPALHLNLSSSCWTYAGTVCSDGTESETGDPVDSHELADPVIEADSSLSSGQKVTYDCVYYGRYRQTDTNQDGVADDRDDMEPIKWRVLSVNETDALLLADRNLDLGRYNESGQTVTWEQSTLRSWLNGYDESNNAEGYDYRDDNFMKTAFSPREQARILSSDLNNPGNQKYGTDGGNSTTDKVFVLSEEDFGHSEYGFIADFQTQDEAKKVKNTPYLRHKVEGNQNDDHDYWLRTPGKQGDKAIIAGANGVVDVDGLRVSTPEIAIRPAIHLNLLSKDWVYAGKVTTDGGSADEKYSGYFYFNNAIDEKIESKYPYNMDFAWFDEPSDKYDHDLARMSIRVAMASMARPGGTDYSHLEKLYDDLEFHNREFHYPKPNLTTVGFGLATKTMLDDNGDQCDLILVGLRGGGYGNEWSSNVTVGVAEEHEGFRIGADAVLHQLERYIAKNKINKESVKIWICGYSRGAAISNLVAAKLNTGEIPGIQKNNVYAYCFETPQNTRVKKDLAHSASYNNIFNIINPYDIVPEVAMDHGAWNYTRYGIDYVYPCSVSTGYTRYTKKGFGQEGSDLRKKLRDMIAVENQYYQVEYEEGKKYSTGDLLTKWGCPEDKQPIYNATIIKDAITAIPSPEAYNVWYQQDAAQLLSNGLGGIKKHVQEIFLLLVNLFVDISLENALNPGFAQIADGAALARLLANVELHADEAAIAHYPEVNLAWIEALTEEQLKEEKGYCALAVNCPIDVEVYKDGELVGAIYSDEPQEMEDGVITFVDEGGQKLIYLPDRVHYDIKLKATDDGEMSVLNAHYTMGSQRADNLTSYYNVDIQKDEVFDTSVSGHDILMKKGEEIIPISEEQSGEEVQYYRLSLALEGDGEIQGSGVFLKGEYTELIATERDNNLFDGWFDENGKLISADKNYRMQVLKDRTITAKFHQPEEKPVIDNAHEYVLHLATRESVSIPELAKAPTDGKNYKIEEAKEYKSIAVMSSKGVIKAKKVGIAHITVHKGGEKFEITVICENPMFREKSSSMNSGEKYTPVFNDWGLKPTFSIPEKQKKYAKINAETGEITANEGVCCTLTVTATIGNNRKTSTKVKIYDPTLMVKADQVKVGKILSLSVKKGVKLTTWSVENGTGSASIDNKGKLRALAEGTVTVKAVNNGRALTKRITIVP